MMAGNQGDDLSGAVLFARYAYPPNELGYCGPADHRALLEYGAGGTADAGLRQLARGFLGAWPYLALIAEGNGIADPLDRRVVEAYWVGNTLLDRVDTNLFGNSMRDRFRPRTGLKWSRIEETVPAGAVPHHSFHVFGIYPWVGLLGADHGDTPLHVLDQCRIRWGQVERIAGDEVVVSVQPLTFAHGLLGIGPARPETVIRGVDGFAFGGDLAPGDWVSLHWTWICDRLSRRQLRALRHFTGRQLAITNHKVEHSGPASVLS